jgi:DNA-binding MarR family transcriptional regulator
MSQNSKDDRNYILWMLIAQTWTIVNKAREKELSQYGFTPQQSGALFAIHALGEGATISALGTWLIRELHSVSNLINRMEHHGLVTKRKAKSGKKPATYMLTQKGKEAYHYSTKRESIYKIMSTLSEEEGKNLELCLRKIQSIAFKIMVKDMKPPWP